jgi:hypothetical protein
MMRMTAAEVIEAGADIKAMTGGATVATVVIEAR